MLLATMNCAVRGFLVRNSAVDDTGAGSAQMRLNAKIIARCIRMRILMFAGERVEKPLTRSAARRLGLTVASLEETGGMSEVYTWALIGADNSPSHVVKAPPMFGIKPLWRRRKKTRLFDRTRIHERISFANTQANLLNKAGYGPAPASAPEDRYCVIEWVTGVSFEEMAPDRQTIIDVVSSILNLNQLGIHHGDLHTGNILISADSSVQFIDSDNRFAPHVSDEIALAVDLGTLLGSLLTLHGSGSCIEGDHTIAQVIGHRVGEEIMSDMAQTALDYKMEHGWLRVASGALSNR